MPPERAERFGPARRCHIRQRLPLSAGGSTSLPSSRAGYIERVTRVRKGSAIGGVLVPRAP